MSLNIYIYFSIYINILLFCKAGVVVDEGFVINWVIPVQFLLNHNIFWCAMKFLTLRNDGWKWLDIAGIAGNCWKWLEMAKNG